MNSGLYHNNENDIQSYVDQASQDYVLVSNKAKLHSDRNKIMPYSRSTKNLTRNGSMEIK